MSMDGALGGFFYSLESRVRHNPLIEFSVTERFGSIAYFISLLIVHREFSLPTRKNWRKETYLLAS